MAASVSAWSKPGAWALDAEEHEEELLQEQKSAPNGVAAAASTDFPSLAAAVTTKPKKKKGQTMPLAQFAGYASSKSAHSIQTKNNFFDEAPLALPNGPRERTAEELERNRGFRSYGSDRGGRGGEDSSTRWGSSRASDEGRKFGREPSRESGPSRADEADDWGATKKSSVGNGFERRDRDRGGFFDSQSRADESDSWVSNKTSVPAEGRRFGGSGGGFDRERRGGFEREVSNGGGADSDNWGRKKEDSGPVSNGRPRLVLQPRTLPVTPVTVAPVSPESNEKQEVPSPPIVPKQKTSNPFGAARPREEVLAEKGQDWKEIDEKLESTKVKETVEKGERGDKLAFGSRRSFGSGNGRASLLEERAERSWRKPDTVDARPESAERVENGVAEENGREIDEQVTEG